MRRNPNQTQQTRRRKPKQTATTEKKGEDAAPSGTAGAPEDEMFRAATRSSSNLQNRSCKGPIRGQEQPIKLRGSLLVVTVAPKNVSHYQLGPVPKEPLMTEI